MLIYLQWCRHEYVASNCWSCCRRNRWCWYDLSSLGLDRRYVTVPGRKHSLFDVFLIDKVPLRDVATWRGYVNVAATVGRSAGGPFGGYLADTIGWRW